MKHIGPLLVIWGASMLCSFYIRDIGSSLMFFGGFLAVLYVATTRLSLVLAGLAMFFVGAAFLASSSGTCRTASTCGTTRSKPSRWSVPAPASGRSS